MKNQSIGLALLALGVSSIVALTSTAARAAVVHTVANDTFDDGISDGPAALDIPWTRSASSLAQTTVSDATLNSQVMRQATSSSGTFVSSIGTFAKVDLVEVGDYVNVSFRFRVEQLLSNSGVIRFGLYDALTTPAANDNGLSTDDDKGYYANIAGGTSTANFLREEPGTATRILSGADGVLLANAAAGKAGVTTIDAYNAAIRITREGAGVRIVWSFRGEDYVNFFDSTPQTLSYNEFAFQMSEGSKSALLDDVVVTTNVPEPAAAGLAGLSLAAASLTRRRRRHASR